MPMTTQPHLTRGGIGWKEFIKEKRGPSLIVVQLSVLCKFMKPSNGNMSLGTFPGALEETHQMRALTFSFICFMVCCLCTEVLKTTSIYLIGNSQIGLGGFATKGINRRQAFPIYKVLLIIIRKKQSHVTKVLKNVYKMGHKGNLM